MRSLVHLRVPLKGPQTEPELWRQINVKIWERKRGLCANQTVAGKVCLCVCLPLLSFHICGHSVYLCFVVVMCVFAVVLTIWLLPGWSQWVNLCSWRPGGGGSWHSSCARSVTRPCSLSTVTSLWPDVCAWTQHFSRKYGREKQSPVVWEVHAGGRTKHCRNRATMSVMAEGGMDPIWTRLWEEPGAHTAKPAFTCKPVHSNAHRYSYTLDPRLIRPCVTAHRVLFPPPSFARCLWLSSLAG